MVGIVEEGLENGTGGVTVGTCDGELGVGEMLGKGGEDVLGKDGEDMWGKVGSSKRVCCVMYWTKGNLFERRGAYVVSHAIFVPVGGGGLIAGIAAYVERVSPQVKIIGVEPTDADGVAVKEVGEETFRLCKELVDGVVLVSRDSICASIKDIFEEKRSILEPAGALALAGAEAYCKYYGLKGENVVAITSGANMNFDNLRVVTELANVGRKQEAVLATVMPEEPGSFKKFCQLVGQMNITEFKYRFNSNDKAVVLYSVGVHTVSELKAMQERMESSQLKTYNLPESDLVKDHLRYLMGGRSNVQNEVLCRFIFQERPGALMKFLDSFSPRWNISLFDYRGQGETGANVLVRLGYDYTVVNNDNDSQLLMR